MNFTSPYFFCLVLLAVTLFVTSSVTGSTLESQIRLAFHPVAADVILSELRNALIRIQTESGDEGLDLLSLSELLARSQEGSLNFNIETSVHRATEVADLEDQTPVATQRARLILQTGYDAQYQNLRRIIHGVFAFVLMFMTPSILAGDMSGKEILMTLVMIAISVFFHFY